MLFIFLRNHHITLQEFNYVTISFLSKRKNINKTPQQKYFRYCDLKHLEKKLLTSSSCWSFMELISPEIKLNCLLNYILKPLSLSDIYTLQTFVLR